VFKLVSHFLWLWLFLFFLNYVSFLYCLGTFAILKFIFRAPTAEEEEEDQVRPKIQFEIVQ
jgi:hypothetical protein